MGPCPAAVWHPAAPRPRHLCNPGCLSDMAPARGGVQGKLPSGEIVAVLLPDVLCLPAWPLGPPTPTPRALTLQLGRGVPAAAGAPARCGGPAHSSPPAPPAVPCASPCWPFDYTFLPACLPAHHCRPSRSWLGWFATLRTAATLWRGSGRSRCGASLPPVPHAQQRGAPAGGTGCTAVFASWWRPGMRVCRSVFQLFGRLTD